MDQLPDTVGVRELRQNLSVYLRRVAAGQTLRVTERGTPVAVLMPLPDRVSAVDRLVAAGLATAPAGDLLAIDPLPLRSHATPLGEVLQQQRDERR